MSSLATGWPGINVNRIKRLLYIRPRYVRARDIKARARDIKAGARDINIAARGVKAGARDIKAGARDINTSRNNDRTGSIYKTNLRTTA
jgi:hypothetical protein